MSASSSVNVQSLSREQIQKFADSQYLYALLDCYGHSEILRAVEKLGQDKAVSLFSGEAQRKYAEAAPYLVQVDQSILDWIQNSLTDVPWGVFVISKSDLLTLRSHFQRFLIVELPDGEHWFFRYYDPRILPTYVRNCEADELKVFLGPVRAFGVTHERADVELLYTEGPPYSADQSDRSIWKVTDEQVAALKHVPTAPTRAKASE